MRGLEEVEYILRKMDSVILDVFDKAKSELDKSDWLKPLIDKYGGEENIPWKERRKLLLKGIAREISSKDENNVLREILLNEFAQWIYAKRLLFNYLGLHESDLDILLDALRKLHARGLYPDEFIIWNPTHGALRKEMISKFLIRAKDNEELFVKAMDIGYYFNKTLRNISPLILLTVLLPSIDKEHIDLYVSEGETALKLFMIKDYWYSFIEKRTSPDKEHWEFWIEFIKELRET